jgi:hypothetical protein
MNLKRLTIIGLSICALAGVAVLTVPELAAAAPGDQLTLTPIGQFFFPADERVTSAAGARRVDLRAIVSTDRVGIDVTRITRDTDFVVDASFVCTGGREAAVQYTGDFPLSDRDDRFLRCASGRRGDNIFGAIGLFEPPAPR